MSITDELRHLANEAVAREEYMYELPSELISIAERIDVMMKDRIELPKDADGQVWTGKERVFVADNGSRYDMRYLMYDGNDWLIDSSSGGFPVDCCHHVEPDSWERIIEDAQADGVRYHNEGKPSDFDALVERCKRLAGEDA